MSYYFKGPHSTPFYNDSCSDTDTIMADVDGLSSRPESSHFLKIKEEIDDNSFFKANNNNLHLFGGKTDKNLF